MWKLPFYFPPSHSYMKDIGKKLEHVSRSTPDLPLHRAALRRALLSSKPFEGLNSYFMSKLLPVSLALVLLLMFNIVQKPKFTFEPLPIVSAEELMTGVLIEVQALSSEEIAQVEKNLGTDIAQFLKDAQAAENLHYSDLREEVDAEGNRSYLLSSGIELNESRFSVNYEGGLEDEEVFESLIFLHYTTPEGAEVDLGVDAQKVPAIVFMTLPEGQIEGIHILNGPEQ